MKLSFIIFLSLFTMQVFANSVGLVCLNPQNNTAVEDVVLFDFAEGHHLHGDQIAEDPNKTEEQYYEDAIAKLNQKSPYLGHMLAVIIKEIKSDKILNVGPFSLDLTSDANSGLKFRICANENQDPEVKQVANFLDNLNELRVDKKYFSKMSAMNKAGLFIHEAIFRVYRKHFNLQNSSKARRFTSLVFSSKDLNNAEFNGILTELVNSLFFYPITDFEKNVLTGWGNSQSFEQAEAQFTRTLILPFGITYKTALKRENLVPYQMMVMLRDGSKEFVNDRLSKVPKVGEAIYGTIVGTVTSYMVVGAGGVVLNLLIIIGSGGTASIAAGVAVVATGAAIGVAAAGLTVIGISTMAQIRYQRVSNYLVESYQCVKSASDCSGKEFKHLNKLYTEFVVENPEHDNIDIKEYAGKVVSLSYENKFFSVKKGMFMKRTKMKAIVNSSF